MGDAIRSRNPLACQCARCGAPFECGALDPRGCWCAALPPLTTEQYLPDAGCLCPRCLQDALAGTTTG